MTKKTTLRYDLVVRAHMHCEYLWYVDLFGPRCTSAKFQGMTGYKTYQSAVRAAKRMGFEPREEKQ